MQSDLGKLFIGGISWDTNEERLHQYFSRYGEVLESMIMKDRATGRARGFGFVVFADPSIAERVTKEKHNIDGRMVEAKKAVPRDDKTATTRTMNIVKTSSPGQNRKIFVGGLASTVTENEFKMYFNQFGNVTDAVVMYDHNTKRPRGFGFITYDSQQAINNVLLKTLHQLNGKTVEVKRAVPKELSRSPTPTRTTLSPYPYSNSINGYNTQGPIGGYNVKMGLNFEPNRLSPYFGDSISYDNSGDENNVSFFSSNLWGNGRFDGIGSMVSPQNGGNERRNTSGRGYDAPFLDFYGGGGGGGGSGDLT